MSKSLFPYKLGDVARGNWKWAVGASSRIPEMQPPLCVAVTNFYGANAAGYDCEIIVRLFAEAPAMRELLQDIYDSRALGPNMTARTSEILKRIASTESTK